VQAALDLCWAPPSVVRFGEDEDIRVVKRVCTAATVVPLERANSSVSDSSEVKWQTFKQVVLKLGDGQYQIKLISRTESKEDEQFYIDVRKVLAARGKLRRYSSTEGICFPAACIVDVLDALNGIKVKIDAAFAGKEREFLLLKQGAVRELKYSNRIDCITSFLTIEVFMVPNTCKLSFTQEKLVKSKAGLTTVIEFPLIESIKCIIANFEEMLAQYPAIAING